MKNYNAISTIVLILISFLLSTTTANVNDGLVGYWSFDEGEGSVAYDTSGNGINGVINGAEYASGIVGYALSFDGLDDYVKCPADLLPTAERTVSLWFYADSVSSYPTVLGYGGDGYYSEASWLMVINLCGWGTFHMHTHWNANQINFHYSQEPVNSWYHYVITTDSSGTKMYVNGELVALNTTFVNNTAIVSGSDLAIGVCVDTSGIAPYTDGCVGYFDGLIDEVRIYNRAITDEEIRLLFNSPEGSEGVTVPQLIMQDPNVLYDNVFTGESGISSVRFLWNEKIKFMNDDIEVCNEDGELVPFSVSGSGSKFLNITFGETLLNDVYTITINDTVTSVETGNAIDGDEDGLAGGDAVIVMEHRQRHDSDNDNDIDLNDLAELAEKWLWVK